MSKTNTARKRNGRFKQTKGVLSDREKAILAASGLAIPAALALTPNPIRRAAIAGGKRVGLRISGTQKRIVKRLDNTRTPERLQAAKDKRVEVQTDVRKRRAVKQYKKSQARQKAEREEAAKQSAARMEKLGLGGAAKRAAERQAEQANTVRQATVLNANKKKRISPETAAAAVSGRPMQGTYRVAKEGRPNQVIEVVGKDGKVIPDSRLQGARLGPDGTKVPVKGDTIAKKFGDYEVNQRKVKLHQAIQWMKDAKPVKVKHTAISPYRFDQGPRTRDQGRIYQFAEVGRSRTPAGTFAPESAGAGPDPLAIRLAYLKGGRRKDEGGKRKRKKNGLGNSSLIPQPSASMSPAPMAQFSEGGGLFKRKRRRGKKNANVDSVNLEPITDTVKEGVNTSGALIRDTAIVEANNAVAAKSGRVIGRLKMMGGKPVIVFANPDRGYAFDAADTVVSGAKNAGFLIASGGLWQIGSNYFTKSDLDKMPAHLRKRAKKLTSAQRNRVIQRGAQARSAAETKARNAPATPAKRTPQNLTMKTSVNGKLVDAKPKALPNPEKAAERAQRRTIDHFIKRNQQARDTAVPRFVRGLKRRPLRTVGRTVARAAKRHPFLATGLGLVGVAGGVQAMRGKRDGYYD